MASVALLATIVVALSAHAVRAQTLTFFGVVGASPVFVSLERVGNQVSGWYFYTRRAKDIRLQGTIEANNVAMDEFGGQGTAKTGHFSGQATDDSWSGVWRSPDGRELKFLLRPDRDVLSDLGGRLRCRTAFSDSGYTFTNALDLTATAGRVTRFAFSQDVTGFNDQQGCSIALSDLRQVPAPAGILLVGKVDDAAASGDAAKPCSVHLLGSSDSIVVQVDGCKQAGGAMLCSARGSWSDLVVDRRTQTCKAIR